MDDLTQVKKKFSFNEERLIDTGCSRVVCHSDVGIKYNGALV